MKKVEKILSISLLAFGFLFVILLIFGGPIAYGNGVHLGTNAGFGISKPTESSSSATSYTMGVEGYYLFERDAWSQFQLGMEGLIGQSGFYTGEDDSIDNQMTISGLMVKGGYGYQLSQGIYLSWSLGGGPAYVNYQADYDNIDIESKKREVGLLARGALELKFNVSDNFVLSGGVRLSRIEVNIRSVKVTSNAQPSSEELSDFERKVALNSSELYISVGTKL